MQTDRNTANTRTYKHIRCVSHVKRLLLNSKKGNVTTLLKILLPSHLGVVFVMVFLYHILVDSYHIFYYAT